MEITRVYIPKKDSSSRMVSFRLVTFTFRRSFFLPSKETSGENPSRKRKGFYAPVLLIKRSLRESCLRSLVTSGFSPSDDLFLSKRGRYTQIFKQSGKIGMVVGLSAPIPLHDDRGEISVLLILALEFSQTSLMFTQCSFHL